MRGGADVVYQATFFDGTWRGHADFLLRRSHDAGEPDSALGPWHYEVADTKLARHVKASAILQICSYVEQLTAVQGQQPEYLYVVLGGSERPTDQLRVDDYMAYYRRVKAEFEAAVGLRGDTAAPVAYPPVGTYPEPVEHCDVCRWAAMCKAAARRTTTCASSPGAGSRPATRAQGARRPDATRARRPRAADGAAARRRRRGRAGADPRAGPDPGRGRGRARGPVGAARRSTGTRTAPRCRTAACSCCPSRARATCSSTSRATRSRSTTASTTCSASSSRGCRGRPMGAPTATRAEVPRDLEPRRRRARHLGGREGRLRADDRPDHGPLGADPAMHVYHYAAYERTALGRLWRSATARARRRSTGCFAAGVLVDLFRVVRQGIRAGVESYSIKRIEPLYALQREVELKDAGSSIVAFETWLEMGAGDAGRRRAGDPGRDRGLQPRRRRQQLAPPRLARGAAAGPRGTGEGPLAAAGARRRRRDRRSSTEREQEVAELVGGAHRRTIPDDPVKRAHDPEAAGRWLLAQLLAWHRREDKSAWWRFFELMGKTDDELIDEREPIGGLELRRVVAGQEVDPVPVLASRRRTTGSARTARSRTRGPAHRRAPSSRSTTRRARSRSAAGSPEPAIRCPARSSRTGSCPARSWPRACCGPASGSPRNGLGEVDRDDPAAAGMAAVRALLLRRPPDAGQGPGVPLRRGRRDGARGRDADRARPRRGGILPIQGPPGSGKTYTGARVIVALVAAGKRVGVVANSHKVIGKVLDEVAVAAAEAGVRRADRTEAQGRRAAHPRRGHRARGQRRHRERPARAHDRRRRRRRVDVVPRGAGAARARARRPRRRRGRADEPGQRPRRVPRRRG